MQHFTDGSVQMYAVFHGDGYECSDFVGIFETEEQAEKCAALVKAHVLAEWKEIWSTIPRDPHRLKEDPPDIIAVKAIVVGQHDSRYDRYTEPACQ